MSVLSSGTSRSPDLMDLVRTLFYLSATYHFEIMAVWIDTKTNTVADALSRLDFFRFWNLANIVMTEPNKEVFRYFCHDA